MELGRLDYRAAASVNLDELREEFRFSVSCVQEVVSRLATNDKELHLLIVELQELMNQI